MESTENDLQMLKGLTHFDPQEIENIVETNIDDREPSLKSKLELKISLIRFHNCHTPALHSVFQYNYNRDNI